MNMNKLETIRAAVDKHFAAKEAHEHMLLEMKPYTVMTSEQRIAYYGYNSQQHPAMLMLRDLLPLLDAAVKIELNDGKLPEFTWYGIVQDYENEVAKLLEETE